MIPLKQGIVSVDGEYYIQSLACVQFEQQPPIHPSLVLTPKFPAFLLGSSFHCMISSQNYHY